MATHFYAEILTAIGYPCYPHDGQYVFTGDAAPKSLQDALEKVPASLEEFLRADLAQILVEPQLTLVKTYQDSELKKLSKTAILEALAEHLYNDGEVDMPSETWATAKADAIASVQASLSAGLVAEVLVEPKVIVK